MYEDWKGEYITTNFRFTHWVCEQMKYPERLQHKWHRRGRSLSLWKCHLHNSLLVIGVFICRVDFSWRYLFCSLWYLLGNPSHESEIYFKWIYFQINFRTGYVVWVALNVCCLCHIPDDGRQCDGVFVNIWRDISLGVNSLSFLNLVWFV